MILRLMVRLLTCLARFLVRYEGSSQGRVRGDFSRCGSVTVAWVPGDCRGREDKLSVMMILLKRGKRSSMKTGQQS